MVYPQEEQFFEEQLPHPLPVEAAGSPVDLCAKVLKSLSTFSPLHSGQEILSSADLINNSKTLLQSLHLYSNMGIIRLPVTVNLSTIKRISKIYRKFTSKDRTIS
jgi:hypothetical protein